MKNTVIDLHGDLFSHFTVAGQKGETDIFKKYHLANFKKGHVYFSVFNIWIDDEEQTTKERALQILSYGAKEVFNNQDILNPVYKFSDIQDDAKINFLIGLEGIDYLDNAEELYTMYQYGARLASLTWNHSNAFAASITDKDDFGLTEKGRQAIKIMNELGMIVDISHLSDKAALEILDIAQAPVIASHSNVRNLAGHKRNLSDELINGVVKTGGVIGMNAYPLFASDNEDAKNVKGLVNHIDYLKELIGIDYIAFGFDFMDYLDDGATSSFVEGSPFMSDLKNHSDIKNLISEMESRGYTSEELAKVTHENALRVMKAILK